MPHRHPHTSEHDLFKSSGSEEAFDSLEAVREAVDACERCPLYQFATQAIFGEGPERAPLMFVGEQPGDQEDIAGRPFVGPAGKVFDAAQLGRFFGPPAWIMRRSPSLASAALSSWVTRGRTRLSAPASRMSS
ncbi:MAG: hypothetical protein HY371_16205, partial [Devosia nanyangense]|nr:hypothetical protein [Devosia nanyangense]